MEQIKEILRKGEITRNDYDQIMEFYKKNFLTCWFGCVGNGGRQGTQSKYEFVFNYRQSNEERFEVLLVMSIMVNGAEYPVLKVEPAEHYKGCHYVYIAENRAVLFEHLDAATQEKIRGEFKIE